jgi:SAM-dependent methyltransferase
MTDCRVCGGNFRSTFRRGQSQYGCCASCGSINKILTLEEYLALKPTYDPGDLIEAEADDILDRIGVPGKIEFLRGILPRISSASGELKLLDVGCGTGGYLLAAQALGMTACGVEPSETHSRIGRERFGLDISTGYLMPENMTERFNIIILSHVIEHIYEPREFIARLVTVLAPGGILVVVTPNAASPLARLAGPAWAMLAPIDHVTMFGPGGISRVTPPNYICSWRTDEHVWEPAATLLVTIRNRLTGASPDDDQARNIAIQSATRRSPLDNRLFKFGLAVVSAPFWLAFKVLRCGACLVAEYRHSSVSTN